MGTFKLHLVILIWETKEEEVEVEVASLSPDFKQIRTNSSTEVPLRSTTVRTITTRLTINNSRYQISISSSSINRQGTKMCINNRFSKVDLCSSQPAP